VKPDGSNFRNITNSESEDLMPTWSPDGTKIAFISDRAEDLGRPIINVNEGIYSNAVFIMDRDGTKVKRVSPYSNESINWINWVGP
jgi:Tol biopolymer transport system component